jgi:hypothetical protein
MTVEIGSPAFTVDLQQFSDAITVVSLCVDAVGDDFSQIQADLSRAELFWHSPAAQSLPPLVASLRPATQHLMDLLTGMVFRMRQTYQVYEQAEQANAANLT